MRERSNMVIPTWAIIAAYVGLVVSLIVKATHA